MGRRVNNWTVLYSYLVHSTPFLGDCRFSKEHQTQITFLSQNKRQAVLVKLSQFVH